MDKRKKIYLKFLQTIEVIFCWQIYERKLIQIKDQVYMFFLYVNGGAQSSDRVFNLTIGTNMISWELYKQAQPFHQCDMFTCYRNKWSNYIKSIQNVFFNTSRRLSKISRYASSNCPEIWTLKNLVKKYQFNVDVQLINACFILW